MTFDVDHYVPFLKGKQGEFSALAQLSGAARSSLTPLIDVPRVPIKNRAKPLENHLDKQAKRIADAWGGGRSIFVDLIDLPLEVRTTTGRHPVTHLGDSLVALGVDAIPVTGTDRDDDYQEAIREMAEQADCAAVRLLPDDLDTPSLLEDALLEVHEAIEVEPEGTHLMMDLRSLIQRDASACVATCANAIAALPAINRYLSLTIAGSSMPQSLSELVKTNAIDTVRRKELDVWAQLQRRAGLARRPTFGDYGAVHPDLMDLDVATITVAADIRYTVAHGMLIIRGASTKHHPLGYLQFHTLARSLVARPEYSGRTFSWADEAIYRKAYATSGEGPGSKTTWVQIATNHHLEFIVQELPTAVSATPSGP